MTALDPDMRWGWRTVRPDFHSQHGYRWPYPGQWAEAPGPILDHNGPCPRAVGDGLCVALTWEGAALGGLSARTPILVVGWLPDDELGRDTIKVRVRRARVADVWSAETILRRAPGANLSEANLARADLSEADLTGANLSGADLTGANLSGADLTGANLSEADLTGANLSEADLYRADLSEADLYRADLSEADLYGADLARADLTGANLSEANLTRAIGLPDKIGGGR